jgi:20S proteasome subunit beta 7
MRIDDIDDVGGRVVQFQIATATATGVKISDSIEAVTDWSFADKIRGYGAQTE